MRKEVILKPEDASMKQEGHKRHSRGEDIDEVSLTKLIRMPNIHHTHDYNIRMLP